MGGHIHEHHLGGDAGPIGEMREVQSHRCHRRRLGPVGSPAPADPVHRPHLEDVGRAVDETGDRMGGVGGADGYPASLPVDAVLVIPDLRAAVALRRLPRQLHLPVSTLRQQIPGRGRHRLAWAAATTAGWSGRGSVIVPNGHRGGRVRRHWLIARARLHRHGHHAVPLVPAVVDGPDRQRHPRRARREGDPLRHGAAQHVAALTHD